MTAKWPLMDRFWAPELAKQACSWAVNIGDWRCRLLRRMSPLVARTGPLAMSDLSPLSGEERKSNFGAVRSVDGLLTDLREELRQYRLAPARRHAISIVRFTC